MYGNGTTRRWMDACDPPHDLCPSARQSPRDGRYPVRDGEWFVTVGNGRRLDRRVQSGGVRMEGSIGWTGFPRIRQHLTNERSTTVGLALTFDITFEPRHAMFIASVNPDSASPSLSLPRRPFVYSFDRRFERIRRKRCVLLSLERKNRQYPR